MGMQTGGGGNSTLADINVTPLVDVMLVLLVIFMVTAPMLSSEKTKVALPPYETSLTLDLSDDDVILVLNLDKSIHMHGCPPPKCKSMSLQNLVETIKPNQRVKQAKKVYIYADQRLKFRFVLQVMSKLNKAGINKAGLVTNPSGIKIDTNGKAK